ncbi:MAG: hypothetical protein M1825_003246 [Sarcosagium campestre]|nr:MAG: hypothetical protein M1825_003246 [Sarcosagium campestre]
MATEGRQSNIDQGARRRSINDDTDYNDGSRNINELAAPCPITETQYDEERGRHSLESIRTQQRAIEDEHRQDTGIAPVQKSRYATFYTISYLILFAILGTLARLGLSALNFYPGAPVNTSVLWANFAGTLFIGFLSEDRMLFSNKPDLDGSGSGSKQEGNTNPTNQQNGTANGFAARSRPDRPSHLAVKKKIPLYIGLTTGFCGSFTSFSTFMLDLFFALSNNLPTPVSHPSIDPVSSTSAIHRNGGYSLLAVSGIVILTVCLCLSAYQVGGHIARSLESFIPILRYQKLIDRFSAFLAWGCWIGAIIMAIWPPDRAGRLSTDNNTGADKWRGQALFALVFAPVGCLARYYASLWLNSIFSSFPLGTFVSNMGGTLVLGIAWDLQHSPLASATGQIGGGHVACQVLQGVQGGFCGCLTTVSTWVMELHGLRLGHSYRYGVVSIGAGLGLLVIIMGSLVWTHGVIPSACE